MTKRAVVSFTPQTGINIQFAAPNETEETARQKYGAHFYLLELGTVYQDPKKEMFRKLALEHIANSTT